MIPRVGLVQSLILPDVAFMTRYVCHIVAKASFVMMGFPWFDEKSDRS